MLVLAGLGISDEKGITLEEVEEAKNADYIFLELYTNIWKGSVENLEKIIEKKIHILRRKDLEEDVNKIVNLAKNKKVIIFVPGDPLVATTHSSIILECMKNGIDYKILHNSSIFSAICETGLHIYKFGQAVTIPMKEKISTLPLSVINTILENKKRGLHTLCLLDIDVENNKFLEIDEAVRFLLENNLVEKEEKIVVVSSLGTKNKRIVWKEAKDILSLNFDLPAVIVIPGKLHFSEKEMLEKL
jgi:diphthine synthase